MGWLGTWAKRIKLTIDAGDIDADLANFPILVYISASSGINGEDISCVFDELISDANRKKIAVTTDDGTTECKVEIEKWDDVNEKAWLWVKVPAIDDVVNTDLYLYYDHTKADNDTNVGDLESTPAMAVWDANYLMVQHLEDAVLGGGWVRQGNCIGPTANNWILEPSVIYDTNPQILTGETNVFKMWYSNDDGVSGVCYAESTDGLNWTLYGSNPVISGIFRLCVLKDGSTYYLYGTLDDTNIKRYHSSDGLSWVDDGVVLSPSGSGWDSVRCVNSFVWKEGANDWRMLYEAEGSYWQIGYATSSDGLSWTKSPSNPVIPAPFGAVRGGPFVQKIGSTYWCWCHGSTSGFLPTDIYRYYSTNLTSWTQSPSTPDFVRLAADEGPASATGQVADPTLLEMGGNVYMWYTACITQNSGDMHIKLAKSTGTFAQLVVPSTVKDSSTNNLDGTKKSGVNPVVNTNSKIADGQTHAYGDYIDLTDSTLLKPTSVTVEAWVKSSADTGFVFCKQSHLNGGWVAYGVNWGFYVAGKIWVRIQLSGTPTFKDLSVTVANMHDGNWHHMAFTYGGNGTPINLYFDGVLIGTSTNGTAIYYAGDIKAGIGCEYDSAGWEAITSFVGSLDEVRVSDSVRLVSWVKATYETGRDHLLDWGAEETLAVAHYVTVTELIGVLDSKTRNKSYYRTVTELIGLKDTKDRTKTINRTITESLGLKDSRSRVKTINRIITELLGAKDIVTKVAWYWSLPPVPPVITAAVGKIKHVLLDKFLGWLEQPAEDNPRIQCDVEVNWTQTNRVASSIKNFFTETVTIKAKVAHVFTETMPITAALLHEFTESTQIRGTIIQKFEETVHITGDLMKAVIEDGLKVFGEVTPLLEKLRELKRRIEEN